MLPDAATPVCKDRDTPGRPSASIESFRIYESQRSDGDVCAHSLQDAVPMMLKSENQTIFMSEVLPHIMFVNIASFESPDISLVRRVAPVH